ncbi:D-alanyl-D-alanine carboxypeptidase [Lutibacter oricola]|uniref:D-alanyl-D-alanine carboxypeptidase n=1 Tax=Lutibacter oricola TaxID=762486 RepID=A0A1H3FR76_9FLAO|nr:M15 family metallopeptidase [Lutibacter oricola]SDX92639.1 D-alanyl-D-alanine carboxypeptidase [Lutibacter oricola]
MKKIYIILIIVCSVAQSYSQKEYSKAALMGMGGLPLVGNTHKLQQETKTAFTAMQLAAKKDGIQLEIVSAYRSFNRQQYIWNRKYKKYAASGLSHDKTVEKIIEYSTLPGTSRHHWGTDIDIIDGSKKRPASLLLEKNYENNGVYSKLKQWMDANANFYGFYLVYTNLPNRKGFKYEPWHYSYLPLAKPMLQQFLKLDLASVYKSSTLKGGTKLSEKFLSNYKIHQVLDINPLLK